MTNAVTYHSEHKESNERSATEAANIGPIRPPIVFLTSIGLGLLVHFYLPVQVLPASFSVSIGVLIVLLAAIIFVSAVRSLRSANTPIPGNQPTVVIVRSGPYGFSRNPIYLAFTLFQVGIATLGNSLWILVLVLPSLAIMALVVVPREERYLEAHFTSEYLAYKKDVRRWI